MENEHRRLLARKSIIEKRKEDLERQILEKVNHLITLNACFIQFFYLFKVALLFQEKEEESKRAILQIKNANDERIRLLNEQKQREQERIRREIEEKNKAEARKLLEDLTKKAGKKHVVVEGVRNNYCLLTTACYLEG